MIKGRAHASGPLFFSSNAFHLVRAATLLLDVPPVQNFTFSRFLL